MHPRPPEDLLALDGSASAWCGGGALPMLGPILDATEQLAPGGHVGICVVNSDDTYTTLDGTDALVFVLDDLQYVLDEGPGITAMREGRTVIVGDAESEHRWPRFMSLAAALGLRSHLGVPISVEGRTLGGLNLYSTVHASVDARRLAHAKLMAARAATALAQAHRENDLLQSLQSSRTIGKAIGLVMEQLNLDDHEAFVHLTTLSQRSNVTLRETAAHLVKQSNDLRHMTKGHTGGDKKRATVLTLVPRPGPTDGRE
ncbi:GAF and ANTAR domain-containing protein [Nostocoides sp. HKS02]|uniref:GAF and ANTAR domain-containing protein n=1 Tax=Nostocoides sp. HKS02 TaxID=1813880 RepID=UPI0018A86C1F|nr:GAF and ANTAR domain-containing protein [Tetrasphaera sp. HKS02]